LFAGVTIAEIARRMGLSYGRARDLLLRTPDRMFGSDDSHLTYVLGVYVGHRGNTRPGGAG
jgi:hypothetical protein